MSEDFHKNNWFRISTEKVNKFHLRVVEDQSQKQLKITHISTDNELRVYSHGLERKNLSFSIEGV